MPFNKQRNSREDNSRNSRGKKGDYRQDRKDRSSHSPDDRRKPGGAGSARHGSKRGFGDSSRFNESKGFGFDKREAGKTSAFKKENNHKEYRGERDRPQNSDGRKPYANRHSNKDSDHKEYRGERYRQENSDGRKPYANRHSNKDSNHKEYRGERYRQENSDGKKVYSNRHSNFERRERSKPAHVAADDGLIRLNRYISNSGVCSRRKADELIAAGVISVNGEVVTELGTKVDPSKDEIRYNNERLKREKMVYILLNKPKDYITTTDDPQERKTVMQLISKATKERVYPVGRLDRNTTGLLLLTNDGNLAEKLSHPRNNISKIYQVELNKALTQGDFNKIQFGIELEDGLIKPDDVSFVVGASKREIGIQIHSGKNRIVRRIFESLGYDVIKLDRVVYANLTKKDLPRGRWRFLEEKELIQLKHLV